MNDEEFEKNTVKLYSNYNWECPVCGTTNFVGCRYKEVECELCKRKYTTNLDDCGYVDE